MKDGDEWVPLETGMKVLATKLTTGDGVQSGSSEDVEVSFPGKPKHPASSGQGNKLNPVEFGDPSTLHWQPDEKQVPHEVFPSPDGTLTSQLIIDLDRDRKAHLGFAIDLGDPGSQQDAIASCSWKTKSSKGDWTEICKIRNPSKQLELFPFV
eukprot:3630529-Rhodomonas_salina.1